MGEGTYYEILGIDVNATEDDIRKAYRKQALLWHPDKNAQRKEEAEAKFKLIAEAYEVLSDPDKKRTYDLYGEEGLKNNGSNQDYDYDFRPNFGFQFHDPRELFNSFFGGRDPFEMLGGNPLFGGGGGFGRMPGFGTRFDDNDFFSNPFGGNFGPTGLSSSSSYSFSSSSSGGGQGGFVSRSISTKIVNGVSTTVTKTVDAQGNETIITESGGRREVLVNNQPQEQRTIDDGRGTTNISIQDGISYYGQRQPPQYQQSQQYHYQQPQQPQQYQQQRTVNPQQFQQRSVNPQQYQQPPQQYHQQHEYQHSKEEDHHHKKHFFNWHRKH